jgi:hypothetical protein
MPKPHKKMKIEIPQTENEWIWRNYSNEDCGVEF